MTHYELGQFDDAIDDFKRAYELTSAPGLFFNLAQVYRMKKDAEQALYFYSTYLRLVPDATNRADVEALIVENQKLVDDAAAERQRAGRGAGGHRPPPRTATPPGETPPTRGRHRRPRRRRPWRIELWTGVGSPRSASARSPPPSALGVALVIGRQPDQQRQRAGRCPVGRAAAAALSRWPAQRHRRDRDLRRRWRADGGRRVRSRSRTARLQPRAQLRGRAVAARRRAGATCAF